jgi:hypothetical protein
MRLQLSSKVGMIKLFFGDTETGKMIKNQEGPPTCCNLTTDHHRVFWRLDLQLKVVPDSKGQK